MSKRPSAVDWVEGNWVVPETRKLAVLKPWQRAALDAMFPPDGSPSSWETFLISTVKKAGKTTLNAMATAYAALTFPAPATLMVVANDMGQAQGRVFAMIAQQCRLSGMVSRGEAVVRKTEIEFPETGTKIVAIPCDYAGEAGGLFDATSWTETWAFIHEGQVRLWEELTPIPNRRNLRIVDSYAGFTGDAPVLEPLWNRAVAGGRVPGDLPIFTDGKLWAYIDQGTEAQDRAWRGMPGDRAEYYAEQARSLRPGTYARLHLNHWQQGEQAFLTSEDWDACVDRDLRPLIDRASAVEAVGPVYVGIDAATKRDCAAVVAVARVDERVRLLDHRIWTPSKTQPLDLEETVQAYVLELERRFGITRAFYDPMQMAAPAASLKRKHVAVDELTQTLSNLGEAAQVLWDLVNARNLWMYPAADLRQHALNAVAVESARGWKLDKAKQSRKVDGVVALSFAVLAAVKRSGGTGVVSVNSLGPSDATVISRGDLTLRGARYLDREDGGRLVLPPRYEERGRR